MSEKLIINSDLLRKESEFRTKSCLVEKAIAVSHGEFEYLKSHPLRDNDLITEHSEMMFCDGDGIYHCLLIYDQEQGDGMLIESEGVSYARYAQYIPRAKELVESHQNLEISLTSSEKQICNLLSEMAERIADAVCQGCREFTIDDVLQNLNYDFNEVKEMMTHAVSQKLSQMDGISSVEVSNLDVPFQPDISVESEEPEMNITM